MVKRATFGEARCGLDAHNCTLVELFDRARTGVGAGTAHASDDRVDEVFNAWTIGFEVEATRTDAFFEERSTSCFDWSFVLGGAIHNSSS